MMNFRQQLANKFYLFSVGLYFAIASVFGWLYLLHTILGLDQLAAIFLGYFITILWRTFYDQLVVYNLKIKQLDLRKNIVLALMGSLALIVLYYGLQKPCGDWAIPITMILSMRVIGVVKSIVWSKTVGNPRPNIDPDGLLGVFLQKITSYTNGLYGFFLGIALVTYVLVKILGLQYFSIVFAISLWIGLLVEQLYELIIVYRIKLTKYMVVIVILVATGFAMFCSTLVFVLIQHFGFSGKVATISGVLILKLTQPLISNLLLRFEKTL